MGIKSGPPTSRPTPPPRPKWPEGPCIEDEIGDTWWTRMKRKSKPKTSSRGMDKYEEVRKKYPQLFLEDWEIKTIKRERSPRGKITCLICGWYYYPEVWDPRCPGDPWICSKCKYDDPRLLEE